MQDGGTGTVKYEPLSTASPLNVEFKYMAHLTIIVATDAERGIGINNTLPWRLPEDLAHFKRTTTGHPIIMGRNTFDSIGRPLPNRRNIVVTRNADWRHDGVEAVASLAAAAALVGDVDAFVIGGAQIYAEALPRAERLIVTEIGKTFGCDAYFPQINPQQWKEVARDGYYSEQNGCDYAFVTYTRK
jgi:dihydrofolate reductase